MVDWKKEKFIFGGIVFYWFVVVDFWWKLDVICYLFVIGVDINVFNEIGELFFYVVVCGGVKDYYWYGLDWFSDNWSFDVVWIFFDYGVDFDFLDEKGFVVIYKVCMYFD